MATRRVTLLGVTLMAARSVQFDRIDPELSREMFIRHALVEADWETRHAFFAANLAALDEVAERETGPGAATSASTTSRCSRCTTSASRPR